MTRKEVLGVIGDNPGKALYVSYKAQSNVGEIGMFHPISKSRISSSKAANLVKEVKIDKHSVLYGSSKAYIPGDPEIVLFAMGKI